jgi:hypothetical protein
LDSDLSHTHRTHADYRSAFWHSSALHFRAQCWSPAVGEQFYLRRTPVQSCPGGRAGRPPCAPSMRTFWDPMKGNDAKEDLRRDFARVHRNTPPFTSRPQSARDPICVERRLFPTRRHAPTARGVITAAPPICRRRSELRVDERRVEGGSDGTRPHATARPSGMPGLREPLNTTDSLGRRDRRRYVTPDLWP